MTAPAATVARLRLDKWLWFARICKSRALAQALVARGQVRLNGKLVNKPAATVEAGDHLLIVLGAVRRRITVRALGERRGPAPEAQALYSEPEEPERLPRDEAALPLRLKIRPST